MKLPITIFVCVCLVGLTQLVWSQQLDRPNAHGVPGYLDPKTGTFTTKVQTPEADKANPLSASFYFGTYKLDIAATLYTPVPSGGIVTCSGTVDEYGDPSGAYNEEASAIATGSGSSWKCDMTIPYAWLLSSPSTDNVDVSYSIEIAESITVGTTSTIVTIRRSEFSPPYTTGVPSSGTVTTLNFGAVL